MASFKEDVKDTVIALLETAQDQYRDAVNFVKETWPLLLLLFVVLIGLIAYWNPPPPRHIVMASGIPGGSYEQLAAKYVEFFAKKGVTIEVVPTGGSQENINRLSDRKDPVQAAFVQGGSLHAKQVPGVESLGSVDYEPIWVFYRGNFLKDSVLDLNKLSNARVAIGPEGSGTHVQAMNIFKVAGIDQLSPFCCHSITMRQSWHRKKVKLIW